MLNRILAAVGMLCFFCSAQAAEMTSPVYELRIYTCEPGKQPALEERFRNHTLRLFEKHGMTNLAYWVPTEEPDSQNTLVYLLQHASREAATASWAAFRADPDWKQVAAESEQKYGKILSHAPESIFLEKVDYSPEILLPRTGQTYELRTYLATDGKYDQLDARFRQHVLRLFEKHGMTAYGYWVPTDAPRAGNTLYYILEFPSREAARQTWESFLNDPEWQDVYKETEKNGSLLVAVPDSQFLRLADFSPEQAE